MDPVLNKLEESLRGKIILLGIGNTLRGDDGFGSILAKNIEGKVGFKVLDAGSAPENFLGSIIKEKPDTVLLVDAVDFGGAVGEVRLLNSETVKTGNLFATHNISMNLIFNFLTENIKMSVYLLAVQPEGIGFAKEMNPKVEGRLKELENWFVEKYTDDSKIIDENKIQDILERTKDPSRTTVLNILKKAREKKGLDLKEAGYLININDPALKQELFNTAGWIKDQIYGERLVFFAPLYISDFCVNDCAYCNFHKSNDTFRRRRLTLEEIEEQARFIINMGHKRILLECGEDPENNNIDYVVEVIDKIYSVKTDKGNIRRLNVNIAATTVENYRKLKNAKIGTYQLFQETYHRSTYEKVHNGPKADYDRQITAYDRAFEAGIDDLGLGVLFGLYDWRFEVLGLISHANYLDEKYKVGPHTISVPRFQTAPTVTFKSPYLLNDEDFLKLIAILRISVPYTGMIISTRERPEIRKQAFKIGISQASAASNTTTGGYGKASGQPQFEIHDERRLEEVIRDVLEDGFLPSFCTACYRRGRTGEAFMDLSKPGEIHKFCRPNGLLTFAEYLSDFSNNGFHEKGKALIRFYLDKIEDETLRKETRRRLNDIEEGKRDIYF